MKWVNHRCITTSVAVISCLSMYQTINLMGIIFVSGAYVGSTLPDREENNTSGQLTFKNHRQGTHSIRYNVFMILVLLLVYSIFPRFLFILSGETSSNQLMIEFIRFTLGGVLGLYFGSLLHILEDALTGTVPHPFNSSKRFGKKLISEPYEYLMSVCSLTVAGIYLMYVTSRMII